MNVDRDQARNMAREWLEKSGPSPFMDIEITPDQISISISKEAEGLLKFLKDEGGITYDPPEISLCG